jgi:hypothetical protein
VHPESAIASWMILIGSSQLSFDSSLVWLILCVKDSVSTALPFCQTLLLLLSLPPIVLSFVASRL